MKKVIELLEQIVTLLTNIERHLSHLHRSDASRYGVDKTHEEF